MANNIISKIPKTNWPATRAWLSDYEKYLESEINSLNNELINLSKNSINESSKLAAEIDGDFFSLIQTLGAYLNIFGGMLINHTVI